jgi:hypothetical protein
MSEFMPVIGAGIVSDGYIINPQSKAGIVSQLQIRSDAIVWAFGDSPIDMPMLTEADHAVVVVGGKQSRSSSMDEALKQALGGFKPCFRQLLVGDSSPRLDEATLPVVTGPVRIGGGADPRRRLGGQGARSSYPTRD